MAGEGKRKGREGKIGEGKGDRGGERREGRALHTAATLGLAKPNAGSAETITYITHAVIEHCNVW